MQYKLYVNKQNICTKCICVVS